ncbi:MAG TPA: hypothetical protein VII06_01695 [Chloroflexota bacterium]|jgi:hypothetical protein
MSQDLSDDDLRAQMRVLARAARLPLSEERIAIDLPAYRSFLAGLAQLDEVDVALEEEPAVAYDALRAAQ